MVSQVECRYIDGSYLVQNPTWDSEDAAWKAGLVLALMEEYKLFPKTICEVGCGTGDVLVNIGKKVQAEYICGYDISPDLEKFWKRHSGINVDFRQADFLESKGGHQDLILLLDIIEHLENPFLFLERIKTRANYFIFHIPLDLSAVSVLRESPILEARRKVGHIHYYTKSIALEFLEEVGYRIVGAKYTGAAFSSPQATLKTRIAAFFRKGAYFFNKDLGVRLLGGETLIVLARPR